MQWEWPSKDFDGAEFVRKKASVGLENVIKIMCNKLVAGDKKQWALDIEGAGFSMNWPRNQREIYYSK